MNFDKKVFVIIASYNFEPWYNQCLSSLRQSDYPVTTIVVDNASTDNTSSILKATFPEVILLDQQENLGFGQANNLGIKAALALNADYCFLLNQDAWILPDTIGKLVSAIEQNQDIWIASPIHLNGDGDKLDEGFVEYIKNSAQNQFLHDVILQHKIEQVYDLPFVNAAAWLLSRKAIETVGYFDSLFYHYGEDVNYCQRILFHGGRIVIVPGASIFHGRLEVKGKMDPFADKVSFDKYIKMLLADVNRTNRHKAYRKLVGQIRGNIIMSILSLDTKRAKFWYELLNHLHENKKVLEHSFTENMRTNIAN